MILGLLALAAAAAQIDGTSWQLAEADWSAAELALLADIAHGLPASFRHPPEGVRLERAPAPELPADLSTPHTVARPRRGGRRIELGVHGLDRALTTWGQQQDAAPPAAVDLLERQLVHALAHRLNAETGWSLDDDWWALSDWGQLLWRRRSAELNALAFASLHGRASPREDLATTIERVLSPARLPGDPPGHPACRMPTKWAWVEARVGSAARAPCATPQHGALDPAHVASVEVLYVQASVVSPASIGGHVLVVLASPPDEEGHVRRDSYGMVALTDGTSEDGLLYAVRGLTGSFPARVVRSDYRATALRYSTYEDRDLLRYQLQLDDAQRALLVERLDEVRFGWQRQYSFFTRNCTELPKTLIESALQAPLDLPPVYAPDTLLGALEREGLVERMPLLSMREVSASRRAERAHHLRAEAFTRLRDALPEANDTLMQAERDLSRGKRQQAYAQLEELAAGISPPDAHALVDLDRILAWSDAVEQADRIGADLSGHEAEPASLTALRAAKGQVRARARALHLELAQLADSQGELEAALSLAPETGSTHTPLLAWGAQPMWVGRPGDGAGWMAVQGWLYRARTGEARRFGLAPGLELAVLGAELRLRQDAQALEGRQTLIRARHILGHRSLANPGWYAVALQTRNELVPVRQLETEWLDAGGVLELWQHDDHRHNLVIGAGGVMASTLSPELSSLAAHSVGTPLSVSAQLASPTRAPTRLDLGARWMPTWSTEGRGADHLQLTGRGALEVGEWWGSSVSVVGRWRTEQRGPAEPLHELGLGVWVEPY